MTTPAIEALDALWTVALLGGGHVPLRRQWPDLAAALDALVDEANDRRASPVSPVSPAADPEDGA